MKVLFLKLLSLFCAILVVAKRHGDLTKRARRTVFPRQTLTDGLQTNVGIDRIDLVVTKLRPQGYLGSILLHDKRKTSHAFQRRSASLPVRRFNTNFCDTSLKFLFIYSMPVQSLHLDIFQKIKFIFVSLDIYFSLKHTQFSGRWDSMQSLFTSSGVFTNLRGAKYRLRASATCSLSLTPLSKPEFI